MCLAVSGSVIAGEELRSLGVALAHGDALRLHLCAGAHALQAIHHHGLAGGESRLHHAQPVNHGAELYWTVRHLVARADDQHVAHRLVSADGAVVDEHRIVLSAVEEPDTGEKSGRELALVVIEERATV